MKPVLNFEDFVSSVNNESLEFSQEEEITESVDVLALHRSSKDSEDFEEKLLDNIKKTAPSLSHDEKFMKTLKKSFS